ncbi:hypothetical protein ACHAXN_006864 [Cyclotella atomus]
MKSGAIVYILAISSLTSCAFARVGGAADDCYYLTKKECKLEPGCSYSKSGKSCSSVEDVSEVEGDECYELSKRQCKVAPGCSYSKSGKSCKPVDDSDTQDKDEDGAEGGGVEELEQMVPALPDMDPPEGWEELGTRKLTKSYGYRGKSGKFHKHNACACYYPLPPGWDMEGGFYCLCI